MDSARAITINQTALVRIVAALIATVELAVFGAMRLPRPVYFAVLKILRPAESRNRPISRPTAGRSIDLDFAAITIRRAQGGDGRPRYCTRPKSNVEIAVRWIDTTYAAAH